MTCTFFHTEIKSAFLGHQWNYKTSSNKSRIFWLVNPLLHRLFLDHDIIFLFLDNMEKIQEKVKFWILLKILWKMEHLLQKSKIQSSHYR